jgi:hypothetical protein
MAHPFAAFPDCNDFASLKAHLAQWPDQAIGLASAVCEAGEKYVEFFEVALARPDDVEVIERLVAQRMSERLRDYLSPRHGRIYWRIPFESEISEWSVVSRYDENGPDRDELTDRKCVKDKNWRRVACYCRLYRATCSVDFASLAAKAAA